MKLSARSPLLVRLADAYASLFLKHSLLRKKLILLLAILENAPPAQAKFDHPDSAKLLGLLATLGWHGVVYAATLILSVILFGPLHLILRKR